MNINNIVLIGFMGVGKGRTARAITKLTGRFALDCDDLIESYANKSGYVRFSTKMANRPSESWNERRLGGCKIMSGRL